MTKRKVHPLDVHSSPAAPNVRAASQRKLGKDGTTWTPTEALKRERLMRQFSARNKGYAVGISEAFEAGYDGIDWKKP